MDLDPSAAAKSIFEFSITAASLIHEILMLPGIRKRAGAIAHRDRTEELE